jgi:hypothetical protein
MARAKFKMPTSVKVVFDGQSHNLVPADKSYPSYLMSGRRLSWTNVAVGGQGWTQLRTTAATRLFPQFKGAQTTILIMNGGTQNMLDNQTGAQIYADAWLYADQARAAGADYVICTTIQNAGPFFGSPTEAQESARQVANGLILADSLGKFDEVVDITQSPLDNTGDQYYYFLDRVHMNPQGAKIMADFVAPALDAVLASI